MGEKTKPMTHSLRMERIIFCHLLPRLVILGRWTENKSAKRTALYVRFGSKADMCSAKVHVRFTPNSDRKSGPPHKVMSALPSKADMCGAVADVCFGPKADIAPHSITSSARLCTDCGTVMPSALAVVRLMYSSSFVPCWTGKAAGLSPPRTGPV